MRLLSEWQPKVRSTICFDNYYLVKWLNLRMYFASIQNFFSKYLSARLVIFFVILTVLILTYC